MEQLTLNLVVIFLAGIGTLYVQRLVYVRRRRHHSTTRRARPPGCRWAAAAARTRAASRRRRECGRKRANMWRELLAVAAAFAAGTGIAALLGAENLGTAMTFGQVAFAATLVALMLRMPRDA